MEFNEITIRVDKLREIAETLNEQSGETIYTKNALQDYLNGNGGSVHSGLFEVNGDTEICVNVTRQLIECTSRFFANAADIFEEKDVTIAKAVDEC